MSEYIYLDNCRGFEESVVPIRDVTFLVGENSTGKSSFLSLYNILHDFSSRREIDFGAEKYNLGSFNDIISKSSGEHSCFTIGISRQDHIMEEGLSRYSMLVSYYNLEGLPKPRRYTYLLNNSLISIRCIDDMFYSYRRDIDKASDIDDQKAVFKLLKKVHLQETNRGFKKLGSFGSPPDDETIQILPSIFASREYKKAKSHIRDRSIIRSLFHQPCVWFAPIRTSPKKMYSGFRKHYSAEGEHMPYLLKKIFKTGKGSSKFVSHLISFGQDGNLFEDIKVSPYSDDESSPFEIHICFNGNEFSLDNVGYGVSQILPIVVELISRDSGTIFNIQQPEVHLHPKAQAALGSLIFELLMNDEKKFLIETHSEFLIDRFRTSIRDNESSSSDKASVLFFERKGVNNYITEINIDDDGNYDSNQPDSFRDFFLTEKLNLLGI